METENATLRTENGKLLVAVVELKKLVRKWRFHATHLITRVKKLERSMRKARVKKVKVKGSRINIQIQK